MRVLLTYPYLASEDADSAQRAEPAGFNYDKIMDSVYSFLLKAGYLTFDKEENTGQVKLQNVIPPEKGLIQNRLFVVNFYNFFSPSGEINKDIAEEFADGEDSERVSWFIKMGDVLKIRFGVPVMEEMANRLMKTYYPDGFSTSTSFWTSKDNRDLILFGKQLWALFLAHHAVKSVYYGDVVL